MTNQNEMGIRSTKIIEREIQAIVEKYNLSTYNKGIDELEKYVLTLISVIDKEGILELLHNVYQNLSEEYEEEIVGDIMNRIHGFCSPNRFIKWE